MTETTKNKPVTVASLTKQIDTLNSKKAAAVAMLDQIGDALPGLIAQRDALAAAEQARAAIETEGLPVGTQVSFTFGRGETRTDKVGTVIAFRPKVDTAAAAYRIEVGEGFDKEVLTVPAASVKAVA